MAKPSITSITIDGSKFNAYSAHFGISTTCDTAGMPLMGSMNCNLEVSVDMHDNETCPLTL